MIFAGKSADSYAGGVQGMQRSFAGGLWGCGFLESAQSGKTLCGIGVAGVDPPDFPVKPLCFGGSTGLDTQFCQLDAGMEVFWIDPNGFPQEVLCLRFSAGLFSQEPAQLGP